MTQRRREHHRNLGNDDDGNDDEFIRQRGVRICPPRRRGERHRADSLPRPKRGRGGEQAEREASVFLREEREERGGLRDVRVDWRVYSVERGVSGGMMRGLCTPRVCFRAL